MDGKMLSTLSVDKNISIKQSFLLVAESWVMNSTIGGELLSSL